MLVFFSLIIWCEACWVDPAVLLAVVVQDRMYDVSTQFTHPAEAPACMSSTPDMYPVQQQLKTS